MSYFDLVSSMYNRKMIPVTGVDMTGQRGQYYGIVNRIEAEDGSGRNFNVTLDTGVTIFCKIK